MAWSQKYDFDVTRVPYQFNLHGLSDLQLGSESTSLSIIKKRIKEICDDPNDCGIIIPGDIEDSDRPTTRTMRKASFAGREEVMDTDAKHYRRYLDDEVIPLLLPLQQTKYGIMGVLAGHHYYNLSSAQNSAQYICMELTRLSKKPVHYLGEMSSFLDFRFKDLRSTSRPAGIRVVGHLQHGAGGGQTKAASLNKIEQAFQSFDADFYIRAHSCQRIGSMTDRLHPKATNDKSGNPEMLHKTVAYLNLGAATRGYEMTKGRPSYIESEMMRPVTCGWGSISFIIRRALKDEDTSQNLKCELRVTV